jgi:AraC-like DNA-binding protein
MPVMVHHADPVALARHFIRVNAHLDVGLAEIADAAHLSQRGLQHAFKKQLGMTPLGYLRSVRLVRAHEELRAEAAAGRGARRSTVNEIARRWHFTHPSRFAATYFDRYGSYPAETLRRGWIAPEG